MDKTDYVGEAERQLANQVHYKRLEEPVFPKSIPKINNFFESLANRQFIDAGQLSYLKCPKTLHHVECIYYQKYIKIEKFGRRGKRPTGQTNNSGLR